MVWAKAGSTTTSSAGDDLDITSMTASKFNQILYHTIASGSTDGRITYNNNTNGVYCRRGSNNGGSDFTASGTAYAESTHTTATDKFSVSYLCSSGAEKLQILHYVDQGSVGVYVPNRLEFVFKFVPSPDADITRIDMNNTQSGSFDTSSNISALGSDLTPSAGRPTDVQTGSRWEETDTRKMYHKVDVTGSDVSLTGLKAYYKFDASSGNIVNKASDVGSTDNLTGADMTITGATYDQTGIIDKALSFDGSNDYGTLGSSLSNFNFLHGTGDWSINFWVKYDEFIAEDRFLSNLDPTETRGIDMAVGWNGDPDGSLGMAIKSDNGFMSNQGAFTFPATVSVGTWVMITMTCDYSDTTNTYKVYLNGSAGGTQARGTTGSTGNSEYSLKLACRGNAGDRFFDGSFDELSIWQRELSQSEITSLYNSGNGKEINSDVWKELGT